MEPFANHLQTKFYPLFYAFKCALKVRDENWWCERREYLFDRRAPLCLLPPCKTRSGVSQSDGTISRLSRARISFPVLKKNDAIFAKRIDNFAANLRGVPQLGHDLSGSAFV